MVVVVHIRSVVEQYMGKKIQAFKSLPKWEFKDYMGWDEQGDGKLFYGIYVQVRAVGWCGVCAGMCIGLV